MSNRTNRVIKRPPNRIKHFLNDFVEGASQGIRSLPGKYVDMVTDTSRMQDAYRQFAPNLEYKTPAQKMNDTLGYDPSKIPDTVGGKVGNLAGENADIVGASVVSGLRAMNRSLMKRSDDVGRRQFVKQTGQAPKLAAAGAAYGGLKALAKAAPSRPRGKIMMDKGKVKELTTQAKENAAPISRREFSKALPFAPVAGAALAKDVVAGLPKVTTNAPKNLGKVDPSKREFNKFMKKGIRAAAFQGSGLDRVKLLGDYLK